MIGSLDRGLRILEILAGTDSPRGVTELGQKLHVDKSTVYRLIRTLAVRGYVEQHNESKKYSLGLKIVGLSSKILDKMEFRQVAKPFMKELVRRTDQTVHLATLDLGKVVCIEQEESPSMVKVNMAVGREAYGHCSAIGKVLWAHLEVEKLDGRLHKEPLTRFTARTITSVSELRMHLKKVRAQGYALDNEEFTLGVRCIAVPVWNHKDRIIASLGLSGLAVNIGLDRVDALARTTMHVRDKLCSKLGYET